jgi:hypothetical protein
MQIDSIELIDDYIYLGASNLEGNKWDGCIRRIELSNEGQEVETATFSGVTVIRKLNAANSTYLISCHDDGCVDIFNADLAIVAHREAHDNIVSGLQVSRGGKFAIDAI